MIDWGQVLQRIIAMHGYFSRCKDNAMPGSAAEQRYGEYCGALLILEMLVKDRIAEEDDGK